MRNIVTQGRVKSANIIEVQTDILSSLINQEVTVIIRKTETSAHVRELLADMMAGRNLGYRRIRRDAINRT